jgi:tetratricopeptide (TPR) repeat protein
MTKLEYTLSQALSRAISAYEKGKLVEVEQMCQQIINAKCDLFDAIHLLAVVQSRLGKKDAALASYDRALKVQPDYPQALRNRGVTLRVLKRFEEALASYDRALALQPDYTEALSNSDVPSAQFK